MLPSLTMEKPSSDFEPLSSHCFQDFLRIPPALPGTCAQGKCASGASVCYSAVKLSTVAT